MSTAFCRQCTLNSFLFHILYASNERTILHSFFRNQLSFKREFKRERTFFICLNTYNNHIIRQRSKHRTTELYTFIYIRGCSCSIAQIQSTFIILYLIVTKTQTYISHRQITHTMRSLNKMFIYQTCSLTFTSFKDKTTHLW